MTEAKYNFEEIIPEYGRTCLYPHGLPFSTKLAENLDDLKKRTYENRRHLPTAIILDGGSGTGKTSAAALVASYLQGEKIDLQNQKGEGAANFLKAVEWCIKNKKRVVIYDEAGDFEKKSTQTAANRAINRVFEVYRTFGIIVILILPNVGKLDNGLFDNNIPRLLIHLLKGEENYTSFAAYSLIGMLWIRHNLKMMERKYPIKQRAYSRINPNFYGHIKRLPEWLQNEIDNSSDDGKLREIKKALAVVQKEDKKKNGSRSN